MVRKLAPGRRSDRGDTTGKTRSRSYSGALKSKHGETHSGARMPLLPFERMMNLPPDQSVVFSAGKHDPVIIGRKPYWKIERLSGKIDADSSYLTRANTHRPLARPVRDSPY